MLKFYTLFFEQTIRKNVHFFSISKQITFTLPFFSLQSVHAPQELESIWHIRVLLCVAAIFNISESVTAACKKNDICMWMSVSRVAVSFWRSFQRMVCRMLFVSWVLQNIHTNWLMLFWNMHTSATHTRTYICTHVSFSLECLLFAAVCYVSRTICSQSLCV